MPRAISDLAAIYERIEADSNSGHVEKMLIVASFQSFDVAIGKSTIPLSVDDEKTGDPFRPRCNLSVSY
jgi:hypothetical protein